MKRQQAFARRVCAIAWVIGGICVAGALGVVTFDGSVHTGTGNEWENPRGSAVQTNYTAYGDRGFGADAFPGSELDELYAKADANYLYLGITGNLQTNANAYVILIDTGTGTGQNALATEIAPILSELPCAHNAPPAAVQGLGQALTTNDGGTPADATDDVTTRDGASTGTVLDTGFAPKYAIAVDTSGGTTHVNQYEMNPTLPAPPNDKWDDPTTGPANCGGTGPSHEQLSYFASRTYRGSSAVNTNSTVAWNAAGGNLSGGTNPNNSCYIFNNTGKLGVTGASLTPPPAAGSGLPGDPRSQTSGLEARISLKDLGFTTPIATNLTLKISILLVAPDGHLSNQTLPAIGHGANSTSLGFRPNFQSISTGGVSGDGNQFATVTRTTGQFAMPTGTLDGTNVVGDLSVANVVASQDTVTSFGDRNCTTVGAGSELDELYMRTDGNYLYVAVSGNLETNGNSQLLFLELDNGAPGQNSLKTEIAPNSQAVACPDNGPPTAVQNMGQALVTNNGTGATERSGDTTTTLLDAGFTPETVIAWDTSGSDLHVTQYALSAGSLGTWNDPTTPTNGLADCTEAPQEVLSYFATHVYRGTNAVNGLIGTLNGGTNPNGSQYSYNNTGTAGVTGAAVSAPGSDTTGDPRTQTTGLEARISLLDLGFAANQLPLTSPITVKTMVVLTSGAGKVSDQTLPGIAGFMPNPACDVNNVRNLCNRPNFTLVPGNQFAAVNLAPAPFNPVVDGRDMVNDFGLASVVASQDTATSFGDAQPQTDANCNAGQQVIQGSELDQLVAREQDTTETAPPNNKGLALGVTGDLETNGNNVVIFLDTKPGGENTLDDQGGGAPTNNGNRIRNMTGIKLPLRPDNTPMLADYAIVMNVTGGAGGNLFMDLIDMQANAFVNDGTGNIHYHTPTAGTIPAGLTLRNGTNDVISDWRMALDDNNVVGVLGAATPAGANDPQPTNALTAITGFELLIPRSIIGNPPDGSTVYVFVALTNSSGSDLSNQFLPSLAPGGLAKYGGTKVDFGAAGYKALAITLGASCNDPRFDADGDHDVDLDDFAVFQRCFTGPFAGTPPSPQYPVNAPPSTYACECFDWGGLAKDNKIDDQDFGGFQFCASRDGVAANAACDDPPP